MWTSGLSAEKKRLRVVTQDIVDGDQRPPGRKAPLLGVPWPGEAVDKTFEAGQGRLGP